MAPERDPLLERLETERGAGGDPLEALARTLLLAKTPTLEDALAQQGKTLGGYLLVRLLGLGGMGATYEAIAADGRHVALKVVDALTELGRARFENECHILRKLEHEAIVGYLDHDVLDDGRAFLVMELVEGLGLLGFLETRPAGSAVADLLALLATVADALHHAHGRGVVHRDIKPQNVLVRPDGRPVVIDFGLSRDLFVDPSLTRSGAIMGTFSYMAPEQLRAGGEVGPAADVFALGLLLYRAAMGEDLRQQPSEVMAHGKRPFLLPRAASERLPPGVQAILYRALEPRPSRRYASARAMAADLRAVAAAAQPKARMPGRLRRLLRRQWTRRLLVVLAALVGIAAILVAIRESIVPYTLSVGAINTPGTVYLNGQPIGSAPFENLEVVPGQYLLRYVADKVLPLEQSLRIDRKHTRVNLLTVSLRDSSKPIVAPSAALIEGVGLLHLQHPGVELKRWLDEKPLDPAFDWFALEPGRHVLRAATADGRLAESQTIEVRAGQLHDVALLSKHLLAKPGRFRLTMQSVLSPWPAGVDVRMDDGVTALLGSFDPSPKEAKLGPDLDKLTRCDTYLTPIVARRWLTAEVSLEFPEPMRSIWCVSRHEVLFGGEIELETRCDTGPWTPLSEEATRSEPFKLAPRSGVRKLWLRARMRVAVASQRESAVLFLAGHINNSLAYGLSPPMPAFAIAADPDPDPR